MTEPPACVMIVANTAEVAEGSYPPMFTLLTAIVVVVPGLLLISGHKEAFGVGRVLA